MRKIAVLVFTAAFLWGGYWFIGSRAVENGLATWLSDRQNDGWVAEYSKLNTIGFPSRFDTLITDLELADPRTGVAWSTQRLEIFALSYRPNHIIVSLPESQTLASPYERITITNDTIRGSVVFEPDTLLALERSSFELDNVALTSDLGWSTKIKTGRFATRQTVAAINTHDISFEASGVTPSKSLKRSLDPAGLLPNEFETLTINSTMAFDAPWDRLAIEQARPQIQTLDLKDLRAKWGDLEFRAAGELQVNAAGVPTGTITIKAVNWQDMLQIAVGAGLIPTQMAPTVERALAFLAGMSGNPKTLDAPLAFKNGSITLGPIPLGPAPLLIIR